MVLRTTFDMKHSRDTGGFFIMNYNCHNFMQLLMLIDRPKDILTNELVVKDKVKQWY